VSRPLRVLQSFPEPRPTTNPYIVQLRRCLDALPEVDLRTFSWRRALLERYDVFHAHWPELLATGTSPARTVLRQVLCALLLVKLQVTRTPLVRTAHNLRPQEGVSRRVGLLLRWVDQLTTLVVRLNEQTPVPAGRPAVTIPHGHYREWFGSFPEPAPQPGRLAYVGLIRPYKNVEKLVRVFADAVDDLPGATLLAAGRPSTPELAAAIRSAAAGAAAVELRLDYLSDAELVEAVGRSQVVVLPYREMHNSGAALMALSLDRPVLLPDNAVTADLAREVGQEWVLRYDGEVTGARLADALRRAAALPDGARPDLGRREWARAGEDHLAAYREALRVRRTRRRASSAG